MISHSVGPLEPALTEPQAGLTVEPPVLDPLASLPWTSHRAPRERGALGTVLPLAMICLVDAIGVAVGALPGMWLTDRSTAAVTGAALLTLLLIAGRPRWRFTLSLLDELPGMMTLLGTTAMATSSVLLLADRPSQASGALLAGGIMTVTVLLSRSLGYLVVRALRRRGVGTASAVVVGSGGTANQLALDMTGDPRHGARFLGFVTEERLRPDAPWPTLGSVDELAGIVRREGVDVVLVAFDGHATEGDHANSMLRAIRALHRERCEVFVAPGLVDFDTAVGKRDAIGVLPLIRLRRAAFRNNSWRLKRVFDITFASVGLLLSSPLLVAIAFAVRGELGRGVIFSQQRIGQDGKPFVIYKFRSLASVDGDTRWNVGGDPALGRVGQCIRSTGLDELPQLFNVLRGDMSVVGPRPERPFFVERFGKTISGYHDRHRVPAGITGYAAVHGLRGDTSIEERAALDNAYADSWSLWLDLKIVLRTLNQLLPRMRR